MEEAGALLDPEAVGNVVLWSPLATEIQALPFLIARKRHTIKLISSFELLFLLAPNFQWDAEVEAWFFPRSPSSSFTSEAPQVCNIFHVSPCVFLHWLEAFVEAHSIFASPPPLLATPLVAAIRGHLHYMRTDTQAGKFEVSLPAEPGILGCLRWVMAKAGAGPGCSLLLRSVGAKKCHLSLSSSSMS